MTTSAAAVTPDRDHRTEDTAMMFVMGLLDSKLRAGQYAWVDLFLQELPVEKLRLTIGHVVIATTYPWSQHLLHREAFFEAFRARVVREKGEDFAEMTTHRHRFGRWHAYVTEKQHGEHPAGSSCRARRDPKRRIVILEFENGDTVELPGARFFIKGEEVAR